MKPEQIEKFSQASLKDDPERRAGVLDQIAKEQPDLAKQLQPAD